MKKLTKTIFSNIKNNGEYLSEASTILTSVSSVLQYSDSSKINTFNKVINGVLSTYSLGILATNSYNLYRRLTHEDVPKYVIQIKEGDLLYKVITNIVDNRIADEDQPVLEVKSIVSDPRYDNVDTAETRLAEQRSVDGDIIPHVRVWTIGDTSAVKIVNIAGHTVTVVNQAPESQVKDVFGQEGVISFAPNRRQAQAMMAIRNSNILIHCSSHVARQEVLAYLHDELKKIARRKVSLYVGQKWGSFQPKNGSPIRDISTVILKKNQLENMIDELQTFIRNEKRYTDMGVPYHHGILLSGAPGTGKSSSAKAIASHLGLDTYFISLSSIDNNDSFEELVSNIPPRAIMLLEDIDIVSATNARDGKKKKSSRGVTMDSLLNVLDGALSPHGVIVIATTNHIEVLDSAVIRPGRIDTVYTIDYIDDDQLARICEKFAGINPEDYELPPVVGLKVSPAEVVGIIKKHIPENHEAMEAVIEHINKKAAGLIDENELKELLDSTEDPKKKKKSSKKTENPDSDIVEAPQRAEWENSLISN